MEHGSLVALQQQISTCGTAIHCTISINKQAKQQNTTKHQNEPIYGLCIPTTTHSNSKLRPTTTSISTHVSSCSTRNLGFLNSNRASEQCWPGIKTTNNNSQKLCKPTTTHLLRSCYTTASFNECFSGVPLSLCAGCIQAVAQVSVNCVTSDMTFLYTTDISI